MAADENVALGAEATLVSSSLPEELATLLNRHSCENRSNTPDFILAQFLLGCLAQFDAAVILRESWYGRGPKAISASDCIANAP